MAPRFSIHALLGLLLGCASADMASDELLDAEERGAPRELHVASASLPVRVLPGQTVELAVRYHPAPGESPAGLDVEFALAGMASGASLMPSRAQTDATGVARTKLRAGMMPGMLQVRAGSARTTPVYVDVQVIDAKSSEARVQVDYDGARELASYTITALPNATCQEALANNLSGDVVHRIDQADDTIQFELAPGSRTAVLAWGSDDTGAPLARGCRDVEAPFAVDAAQRLLSVSVPLVDIALRLEGALPIELALNVAPPLKRIADAASRAVQRAIAPGGRYTMFSEADYYLDAVANALRERGRADELAALEAERSSSTLSASLAPALARAGVGPLSLATKLGTALTERGSVLLMTASLSDRELGAIREVTAQSPDGADSLRLPLTVPATLSSRFDEARAELVVDALRIELGVGQYARALLDQLRADAAVGLSSRLEASAGCSDVFAPWAEEQLTGMCDEACALAACRSATAALTASIEASFTELDATGSAITLAGRVAAHDRTDDGRADDLGPAPLQGGWAPGDMITGELREPARNALTL